MNDDLGIKKERLENNLTSLLELIKDKIEPLKAIEIYENLIPIIKTEIKNTNPLKQKCSSCGEHLDDWEKDVCGSCKVADPKLEAEDDEMQY
jgi:hypothetical protein